MRRMVGEGRETLVRQVELPILAEVTDGHHEDNPVLLDVLNNRAEAKDKNIDSMVFGVFSQQFAAVLALMNGHLKMKCCRFHGDVGLLLLTKLLCNTLPV
jgi:hypothetical protein